MEFGKISPDQLATTNFELPPDRQETLRILGGESSGKPSVYIGCAKWGRKDWIGKIYPPGTKEEDFLPLYGKHFNSIELNATFYKIPSLKQAEDWKSKVGRNFLFIPKISNSISHIHRLKNIEERLGWFLKGIAGFGETLGPVFLMLHPGMGPKSLSTIETFIQQIPNEIRLFVELRHEGWYEDPSAFQDVFDMLERNRTGAVITDVAGRRDCAHMRLTTREAFIRFVGNDLHPTDYTRVDEWAKRIKSWMDAGLQRVYFFLHENEEVHSPVIAKYALQQFNKHCGANLPEPLFVE
ncbi:MAG: DUF72 domain-containing protein [Cyclobacteriaceae bacterium]